MESHLQRTRQLIVVNLLLLPLRLVNGIYVGHSPHPIQILSKMSEEESIYEAPHSLSSTSMESKSPEES